MTRLHYSYAGKLRSMQMSATQLFIFVEGKQCDPYFYAQICSTALGNRIVYEISTARQIPGNTGGKEALLNFFTFLRQRRSLLSHIGGQATACVFFLDKDVDDIQRKKKRSRHVLYTQHYDVQNYVFLHGDLVKGTAAAASVDPRRLESAFCDASCWCEKVARLWMDWIALCLRMTEDAIPSEANYRVLSRVQTRHCGSTDTNAHSALTCELARRAGVPDADFRRRLDASAIKVSQYFTRGEHHRIFKGKWFATILADEVDCIMGTDPYDSKGLADRLPSVIAATLDFSQPWADYFKLPLKEIEAAL